YMTTDIRVKKTRRTIIQTFLNLLGKMPFKKITVAKIYTEAEIAKSTFYDHFKDKYDLLDQIIQSLSEDFAFEIKQKFSEFNTETILESLTNVFLNLSKNSNALNALLDLHETSITLEFRLRQITFEACKNYLLQQNLNNQFSIDFLAHFYSELSLTSIRFALNNAANPDWVQQQTELMSMLQQDLRAKITSKRL
ncbi:TetR/AcrR family transcriptional regulator, partial [Liquorilactobacillus uvarum]|uniref:TetR/AcrR family transcriptional regulator n=2 Tax=Liquorilactobacillus uvarum TaxID=303240 RepID=UPI00288B8C2C